MFFSSRLNTLERISNIDGEASQLYVSVIKRIKTNNDQLSTILSLGSWEGWQQFGSNSAEAQAEWELVI